MDRILEEFADKILRAKSMSESRRLKFQLIKQTATAIREGIIEELKGLRKEELPLKRNRMAKKHNNLLDQITQIIRGEV